MSDAQLELVRLGGGDPFEQVLQLSEAHQREHRCGLFPAGAAVMQLAAMLVRAAGAQRVLDLGCGIGYSTLWLARAAGRGATVIGIDDDPGHVVIAREAAARAELDAHVEFVIGNVSDVLSEVRGPVDAIHDDAWFATKPHHFDKAIALLRPGGLLTMPNWFLLVDAITGEPRNDWEQYAGPTWAVDTMAYAQLLAARNDLDVSWTIRPPLGVAVKSSDDHG